MQHRIILPRSHYADPVDFRGSGKGDVAPVEQTGTDTVSRTASHSRGDAAGPTGLQPPVFTGITEKGPHQWSGV